MIDSRLLSFNDWASRTVPLIVAYGTIPKPPVDEKDWKPWAATICALPAMASVSVPRPQGFDDWRAWSHQFNQQARLLT